MGNNSILCCCNSRDKNVVADDNSDTPGKILKVIKDKKKAKKGEGKLPSKANLSSPLHYSNDDSDLKENDHDPPILSKAKAKVLRGKAERSILYFKFAIESFELKAMNLDDYGTVIKPFIELFIENVAARQIRIINEKANVSGNSFNDSTNLSQLNSSNNNSILKSSAISKLYGNDFIKEKSYLYSYAEVFELSEYQHYGFIIICVKNENHTLCNEKAPNVCFGTIIIPVNNLIVAYSNSTFEGSVDVHSKDYQVIGSIKLSIQISENKIDLNNIFGGKSSPLLGYGENETDDILGNDLINCSKQLTIHQYCHLHSFDIDLQDKYFFSDYDKKHEHIKETELLEEKYPQLSINKLNDSDQLLFDPKKAFESFVQAKQSLNISKIYMILLWVSKSTNKCESERSFELGHEFISFFSETDKSIESFIEIASLTNYNSYILQLMLQFVLSYIKYHRNSRKLNLCQRNYFKDEILLINLSANVIKLLNSKVKNEYITEGYKVSCAESTLICYNIISEIINPVKELSGSDIEYTRSNTTQNYKNNLEVLKKRYSFLRPIESFPNNSQMLSFITRIFRKVIQIVLSVNPRENKIDSEKLGIDPKEISQSIKVGIIYFYYKRKFS